MNQSDDVPTKSDREIQEDVMEELLLEPEVDAAAIGVAVHSGIVTLTGTPETRPQKLAIERAVKRVSGVRAFAEELRLWQPDTHHRSDAEIAVTVLTVVRTNLRLPSGALYIRVESGRVTLEGTVDSRYLRERVTEIVESLAGVREVINAIVVRPHVMAQDVHEAIVRELRRAAKFEGDEITVEVHDGHVVLHGRIRCSDDLAEVIRTVSSLPGVLSVENQALVDGESPPRPT